MPHAVDQAGLVERLFVEQGAQIGADLVFVGIIGDMFFHIFKHVHHFDVGAAVTGALQGTQRRRDGGIGIGAGRGYHMGGKCGVVSAAVLRVQDQGDIQDFGL